MWADHYGKRILQPSKNFRTGLNYLWVSGRRAYSPSDEEKVSLMGQQPSLEVKCFGCGKSSLCLSFLTYKMSRILMNVCEDELCYYMRCLKQYLGYIMMMIMIMFTLLVARDCPGHFHSSLRNCSSSQNCSQSSSPLLGPEWISWLGGTSAESDSTCCVISLERLFYKSIVLQK